MAGPACTSPSRHENVGRPRRAGALAACPGAWGRDGLRIHQREGDGTRQPEALGVLRDAGRPDLPLCCRPGAAEGPVPLRARCGSSVPPHGVHASSSGLRGLAPPQSRQRHEPVRRPLHPARQAGAQAELEAESEYLPQGPCGSLSSGGGPTPSPSPAHRRQAPDTFFYFYFYLLIFEVLTNFIF